MRLPALLAVVLAILAGVAVALLVALATDKREAWDSPVFWFAGYPALILTCALLGGLAPERPARIGFAAGIAQMLTIMVSAGDASLWPLGLVLGAALGVPCALAAKAGSRMRGRAAPREP